MTSANLMASGLVPRTAIMRHFMKIACRSQSLGFTIQASKNWLRQGLVEMINLPPMTSLILDRVCQLGKVTEVPIGGRSRRDQAVASRIQSGLGMACYRVCGDSSALSLPGG